MIILAENSGFADDILDNFLKIAEVSTRVEKNDNVRSFATKALLHCPKLPKRFAIFKLLRRLCFDDDADIRKDAVTLVQHWTEQTEPVCIGSSIKALHALAAKSFPTVYIAFLNDLNMRKLEKAASFISISPSMELFDAEALNIVEDISWELSFAASY